MKRQLLGIMIYGVLIVSLIGAETRNDTGTSTVTFKSTYKELLKKVEGSKDVYAMDKYAIKASIDTSTISGFLDNISDKTEFVLMFDTEPGEIYTIWNNNGTGTFSKGVSLGTVEYWGIFLGSFFNKTAGNGSYDAILVTDEANEIWKNNGDGTFSKTTTVGEYDTDKMAVGDINGDGYDDLMLITTEYNEKWVNNGDGTFTEVINSPLLLASNNVFLSDVNQDGYADLIMVNNLGNEVWLNAGDGNFTTKNWYIDEMTNGYVIAMGDLNKDNYPDAILTGKTNNKIWLNDGTGQFVVSENTVGTSLDTEAIFIGDVDNDGDNDVAIMTEDDNQIWTNDGTGSFTNSGQTIGTADNDGYLRALGKLNGDTVIDAVLGSGEVEDYNYMDYDFDVTLSEAEKGTEEEKYNKLVIKDGVGGVAKFVISEDIGDNKPKYKKTQTVIVKWNAKKLTVSVKGTPLLDEYENILDLTDEVDTLKEQVSETNKKVSETISRNTNCTIKFNNFKWVGSTISYSGKMDGKYKTYKEDGDQYEENVGSWNVKGQGTMAQDD